MVSLPIHLPEKINYINVGKYTIFLYPMGAPSFPWLVVEPTHLKNMLVKIGNLPQIGVKIKNVSNHHPVSWLVLNPHLVAHLLVI